MESLVPPPLRSFLAPLDGDFGGTWIAVSEHGISFGLLNRYQDAPVAVPEEPRSRGLLIPELIDATDLMSVAGRLESIDRSRYRPFTLIAIAPSRPPSSRMSVKR